MTDPLFIFEGGLIGGIMPLFDWQFPFTFEVKILVSLPFPTTITAFVLLMFPVMLIYWLGLLIFKGS